MPNKAVFRDGYVLEHPETLDGFTEVLIEVLYDRVYTPPWFYSPSPHDTIVDFGANVGVFAIDEARRNPTARVIAVEAHPDIFRQLRSNIAKFASQVEIHHAAMQGAEGFVQLEQPTGRSLDIRVSAQEDRSSVTVPAIDFSRVAQLVGGGEIALLKCDIEGAEAEVFESANVLDLKKVRNIALEYHDNLRPGTTERLWAVLNKTHRLLHLADSHGCGIMLWKRLDLVAA
jgi:FkbM family methyltransferase